MNRTLYVAGVVYLVLSGVWVYRHRTRASTAPDQPPAQPVHPTAQPGATSGYAWFTAIKQYCNAVEVEVSLRGRPAPATTEGQGYSAACYALGGKIEQARGTIDRLPSGEQPQAANIVFNVAHPVADAGDDRSAGPIMELVVHYIPDHYMALYHAGMSEYALNQSDLARTHLESFLKYYHENDGWTQNAKDVLARLR